LHKAIIDKNTYIRGQKIQNYYADSDTMKWNAWRISHIMEWKNNCGMGAAVLTQETGTKLI